MNHMRLAFVTLLAMAMVALPAEAEVCEGGGLGPVNICLGVAHGGPIDCGVHVWNCNCMRVCATATIPGEER